MGGHKTIRGSSYPTPTAPPPPPVADYHVTGNVVPDCTCNYFYQGEHNDYPYYKRVDGAFFIYYFVYGLQRWHIADVLDKTDNCWNRENESIIGQYFDEGSVSGQPFVISGPH